MGVVIKQSFWASAFAYLGVGIGYVTTLYLRPKFMDMDQIGLLSLVISNALLLAPFTAMGMPGTLIRFFPHFEDDEQLRRRFLSLQLLIILAANLLAILIIYLNIDWIKGYFEAESSLYNEYIFISLIILVSHSLFLQLQAYSTITMDILVPSALKDVFLRLANAIIILAYGLEVINFEWTVYSLAFTYTFVLGVQAYYIFRNKGFRISLTSIRIPKSWYKELRNYGSYTMAQAGGVSLYTNINGVLVSGMLGLDANGIFTICFYIGLIIELPKRALLQITSPMISKAFKEDRMHEINSLYKRSSLTLGSIGMIFLLGIVCNIQDLFDLIPKGEAISKGFFVVVSVSAAKVIGMMFGFNGSLLSFSKHYKINLYFLIISVLALYLIDIWLIPIYGINGAAIGFLTSTIILNILKHIYIVNQIQLSPFTFAHVKLLVLSGILLVSFYFIPLTSSPLLNIIVKSVLITLIYIPAIYLLRISDDINNLIRSNLKKYLNITI